MGQRTGAHPQQSAKPLKFRRDRPQKAYFAEDDTKAYAVWNAGADGWALRVRELTDTAGVKHAVSQPNLALKYFELKRLAVAVAVAYSGLGDGYQGSASRMTAAVGLAYDADAATTKGGGS